MPAPQRNNALTKDDMRNLERIVRQKRETLQNLRSGMIEGGLDKLDLTHRMDITYSSNALEGNTLTAGETVLVLEKGITISGKPLKDHMEAVDHAQALEWVLEFAHQEPDADITQNDIRNLHHLVVARSKPDIAGQYASGPRHVLTDDGPHHFCPSVDVPAQMTDLTDWLNQETNAGPCEKAFEAHSKFVNIHPFDDGNGRTGRLLMNLLLIRDDFPPIAIRLDERPEYIAALQQDQKNGGTCDALAEFLYVKLDDTLDMYIEVAKEAQKAPKPVLSSGPTR